MELKPVYGRWCDGIRAGFNRTFMELKHTRTTLVLLLSVGFNRTFMELKRELALSGADRRQGFNRTFMELKHTS